MHKKVHISFYRGPSLFIFTVLNLQHLPCVPSHMCLHDLIDYVLFFSKQKLSLEASESVNSSPIKGHFQSYQKSFWSQRTSKITQKNHWLFYPPETNRFLLKANGWSRSSYASFFSGGPQFFGLSAYFFQSLEASQLHNFQRQVQPL